MLRNLRIFGIVVFAVLVGFSTHRLQKLYRSGTLFEQYNSERRSDITLLVSSMAGLCLLGYFELTRSRRKEVRRGFAPVKMDDVPDEEPVDDGLDTASIYAAPDTLDNWERCRVRTSRSKHRESRKSEVVWMSLLRIISFTTPLVYVLLLVTCFAGLIPLEINVPILCGVFGFMIAFSLISAMGIVRKKAWGFSVGYAIAIIHLLFFPIGTAAGLLLLVCLVGASPLVAVSHIERRRQRREAQKKKQKGLRVA